jgi:FemAB-related protein (PEP-CTERM system-associated)
MAGLGIRTVPLLDAQERTRIDDFIAGQRTAELFHSPRWSLAAEQGTGQRSHYLVAETASGTIEGVLPLSEIRSPFFGYALVSAGFGVGGGIVAASDLAADALAAAAWQLAERIGCGSVELRGGNAPADWEPSAGTYAGFARTLPEGDEAILKSIPRKQRAEVRRAQGLRLEMRIGTDVEDRRAHYAVYSESVRNLGSPVFPRRLFDSMLQHFGNDADILTISRDGVPISSVLSFYFRGTVYPYWGGGTREARTLRANELMYYALMRHASARGCNRFDFGRSKLGTGAFAFKKNWGFEPQPLVYWTKGQARQVNPLSSKYRVQVALWKRLPLAAANLLGPVLARGLG